MRSKMYFSLAVILAVSTAQAQQTKDHKSLYNNNSDRTERQHTEKKTQHYAQPESVGRDNAQKPQRKESLKRESSAREAGNTRIGNKSRNTNAAPSPRMKSASYKDLSVEERKALIEKLETAIAQNENNPDFNRKSYQKRIDLLRSLNQ